jgi:hypothetical protein
MVRKVFAPGLLCCRHFLATRDVHNIKANTFSDRCLGSNIEEGRSKVRDAL